MNLGTFNLGPKLIFNYLKNIFYNIRTLELCLNKYIKVKRLQLSIRVKQKCLDLS